MVNCSSWLQYALVGSWEWLEVRTAVGWPGPWIKVYVYGLETISCFANAIAWQRKNELETGKDGGGRLGLIS